MPDSSAVYQPTTVGYTYDTGGNGAGGGGGLRNSFWRIMSRHKISSRRWTEWVLILAAFCLFTTGLTMMIVSLVSVKEPEQTDSSKDVDVQSTTMQSEIEEHASGDPSCIALGASMMLLGLLIGFAWAWLRFFRRSKSPRNGMAGSSGQMLGGLNPSTDLLVGSTSQYGPVLTELPTQLKMKQSSSHDAPVAPLSDQEEETHTLMQDSTVPLTISGDTNTNVNQIPG